MCVGFVITVLSHIPNCIIISHKKSQRIANGDRDRLRASNYTEFYVYTQLGVILLAINYKNHVHNIVGQELSVIKSV